MCHIVPLIAHMQLSIQCIEVLCAFRTPISMPQAVLLTIKAIENPFNRKSDLCQGRTAIYHKYPASLNMGSRRQLSA